MIHRWIARGAALLVMWFLIVAAYCAAHTVVATANEGVWWMIRNAGVLALALVFPLGWYAIITAGRMRKPPGRGLVAALRKAIPDRTLAGGLAAFAILAVLAWGIGMSSMFIGGTPEYVDGRYVIAVRDHVVRESSREEFLRHQWAMGIAGACVGAAFSMFGWAVARARSRAPYPNPGSSPSIRPTRSIKSSTRPE